MKTRLVIPAHAGIHSTLALANLDNRKTLLSRRGAIVNQLRGGVVLPPAKGQLDMTTLEQRVTTLEESYDSLAGQLGTAIQEVRFTQRKIDEMYAQMNANHEALSQRVDANHDALSQMRRQSRGSLTEDRHQSRGSLDRRHHEALSQRIDTNHEALSQRIGANHDVLCESWDAWHREAAQLRQSDLRT